MSKAVVALLVLFFLAASCIVATKPVFSAVDAIEDSWVSKTPMQQARVDGQDNVTISGNTIISGLINGLHNVTVFAEDSFGNMGGSAAVSFTVDVPFSVATVVAVSAAAVVIAGAILLVYFKKRKH
jgi:hypothetical protein